MEIQYFGADCLTLTTKKSRIVIDDNLTRLGVKSVTKPDDIVLSTSSIIGCQSHSPKIFIDGPGEYEVSGISIYGIPARAHMDEAGNKSATMYKVLIDDINVLVVGHVYPALTDNQLEQVGLVDVMIVPVGGNGYTLDGVGAIKLIKAVEPKIVVPVHYADDELAYEVPQQQLESALKSMSMEPAETTNKLKLKSVDVGDVLKIVVLQRV